MNDVTYLFTRFANERLRWSSGDGKEANQMLWRGQNSDVLNALIICIRRFINGGIPIGGVGVCLTHTAILSRIKLFLRQLGYQCVKWAVLRLQERSGLPCRKPRLHHLVLGHFRS